MLIGPHCPESFHYPELKATLQGLSVSDSATRQHTTQLHQKQNTSMLIRYSVNTVTPGAEVLAGGLTEKSP